ncbi:MAG: agmatine deiminase [Desulfobacula sp.]|uniref:agmatine deiminase n=1 Tax=Desulfobacula sp. TaxID=2593537 RepID=UPI0025BDB9A1|nr:agmatine deiminase [Desulfobacula sp.]MCD4720702.1 agmatine deiminase [Desulfobacula sp.]
MSKILGTTPKNDGFRMPGEYESHEKCWMLWPQRADNWRLNAAPAQKAFSQVARAIFQFEPVTIGVSKLQLEIAQNILPSDVEVVEIESDDAWMRDVGPTFVKNDIGEVRGIDWEFNAWGGLNGGIYFPWDKDDEVVCQVLKLAKKDRYCAPFILEGGSIHADGEGTLITTEECLLNPNRNPDLSKIRIENYLKKYLNVEKIIWLGKGVFMDETDGHVDNLCCFVKPGEVLLHWTDDKTDPQYEISRDAFDRLSDSVDAKQRKIKIHKIHQPGPLHMTEEESRGVEKKPNVAPRDEGNRLAGSYVNFYIANKGIVMPLFDDPRDNDAMEKIKGLFPDRKVVGVYAREILLGGGNIHCITQQQPSV